MSARTVLGAMLVMVAAAPAMAQQPPPARQGPRFAQMRQRMEHQLKEALEVNDEQWKALGPKIADVMRLRHDVAVGSRMMFGPPGPPPGGPPGGFDGPPPGGDDGPPPPPGHGARPQRSDGPPPARDDAQDRDRGPGPQGPGGPDGPPPRGPGFGAGPGGHPSAVQEKFDDLQDALDNKGAKDADIKAKIEALHQARDHAKTDLAKAQDDLRKAVNPRQEAILITMGVLE